MVALELENTWYGNIILFKTLNEINYQSMMQACRSMRNLPGSQPLSTGSPI